MKGQRHVIEIRGRIQKVNLLGIGCPYDHAVRWVENGYGLLLGLIDLEPLHLG